MRGRRTSGARMHAAANFFLKKKVFYRNRVPYEKLIYPDPTIFVRVVFFHIIMALEYRRPAYHQSSTIPVLLPYPGTITVHGHILVSFMHLWVQITAGDFYHARVEQSLRAAVLVHATCLPLF